MKGSIDTLNILSVESSKVLNCWSSCFPFCIMSAILVWSIQDRINSNLLNSPEWILCSQCLYRIFKGKRCKACINLIPGNFGTYIEHRQRWVHYWHYWQILLHSARVHDITLSQFQCRLEPSLTLQLGHSWWCSARDSMQKGMKQQPQPPLQTKDIDIE